MKKIIQATLLYLICSLTLVAQEYQELLNNTEWTVTVSSFTGSVDVTIGAPTEVVINNQTYLRFADPTSGGATAFIYLREDVQDKKVYRYINNSEQLLFDFNLEVSDTFMFNGELYTVISVTDLTVNNGTRKRIRLNTDFFGMTWIEGVGYNGHPIKPFEEYPSDPAISLKCSFQNGVNVYNRGLANGNTATSCTPNLSVKDVTNLSRTVTVFPNPVQTTMHIRTDYALNNASIALVNMLGTTVKEEQNVFGNEFTLQRGNLKAGMYFLRITENDKKMIRKIIISE